ncbi:hypothetical protein [Clostridium paraputrificum]|uniref:hypothetical protein n=1 Tax=Clostridium paraputrificum TaxID=29363 RepID=UPI002671ADBB|nr:hypothetical protein [Clostridium paraputrificum]
MNKRMKLKHGILKKKCDSKCVNYNFILDQAYITNLSCVGCKFIDGEVIKNILKENEVLNSKFKRVSINKASRIINEREPKGLFWTKEGEWYIAIDNLTGDAWTKNFKKRKECFDYLEESQEYPCQCFSPN